MNITKLTQNNATVEIREWMNNFIPHFIGNVIIYPCWDLSVTWISTIYMRIMHQAGTRSSDRFRWLALMLWHQDMGPSNDPKATYHISHQSFSGKVGNYVKILSMDTEWKYTWQKVTFSLPSNRLCPIVAWTPLKTGFKTINMWCCRGKHQKCLVQNQMYVLPIAFSKI